MTVISALQNVHVEGSFGNFENKSENELLKIKAVSYTHLRAHET